MSEQQLKLNNGLLPIHEIALRLGVQTELIEPYGRYKAKISEISVRKAHGKLVLVTAINPTPAGEGKTTTSIGLTDALNRIGKRAVAALREPSLGPCFGLKGGATGGGMSQVGPAEDINLHLTGDFHAITSAHNLLAALIDNHIFHGNELQIDPATIVWPRVLDMNDRSLREVTIALGIGNGVARDSRFDITAASEVMAIVCLSEDVSDLRARLGNILIGYNEAGDEVLASDLNAQGAMTALLKDAIKPNLLQTLENNPVLIHGGPFANIAHGCNSVIATKAALQLADFVVTEAGFGADLGAEKFLNIKCRKSGLWPDAVVLVVTVRAIKFHGGQVLTELAHENLEALEAGLPNILRHLNTLRQCFGLPVVVAVNCFDTDTPAELDVLQRALSKEGVDVSICSHWKHGSQGAEALAYQLVEVLNQTQAEAQFLYPDQLPLIDKIRVIAQKVYGAKDISLSEKAESRLFNLQARYGMLPVCIAKTPYSFSADKLLIGAPSGHTLPVSDVRLSRGAGFIVVMCGDVMTMPGLPKHPASERVEISENGVITGLN